jgi:RNA polymerase sigma-70 factor (ECF subfamily)
MKKTIDIENVYDTMSRRLYNMSLRIVGSSTEAEEIMHDTLLQYWHFNRKNDIKDLQKWLSSVCIRKSIDRLRQKQRWKDFLERYEDPALEENSGSEMEYDIQSITKALSELHDPYRVIVSLHLFEGYDYQEISQITGMNENTIRSIYLRGRQKLAAAVRQKRS